MEVRPRETKKREPRVSQTTITVPSLLVLILVMEVLWTLNTLMTLNYFWLSYNTLTIPSLNPTTTTLPWLFFEKGSHSIQVAYEEFGKHWLYTSRWLP
jgi:hypothetical protein